MENFNPLAPRGARPGSPDCRCPPSRFQSTRPSRGETSIHLCQFQRNHDFNPLAPRGARLYFARHDLSASRFQSTRPSRGETQLHGITRRAAEISIHSPLAGRDCNMVRHWNHSINFNPLAPRGARRVSVCRRAACGSNFNPLAPRGARRRPEQSPTFAETFQSTRPSRGETLQRRLRPWAGLFQSTRPSRGETGETWRR